MRTQHLQTLKRLMTLALLLGFQGLVEGGRQLDRTTSQRIEELILSGEARERLRVQFQSLAGAGELSLPEQTDFLTFLADLDARISAQCQALVQQTPQEELRHLPCSTALDGSQSKREIRGVLAHTDPQGEQTLEESVAILDAQLSRDLGEFDEMLLREQQQVRSRSHSGNGPGRGSGSGGSSDAEQGATPGDKADSSTSTHATASTPKGQRQGRRQRTANRSQNGETEQSSAAGFPQKQSSTAPADIPDGSDDDIVARQIREAAEKERDPELKKRLWEEYRRYKKAG